jgi:hypothetical protein
MNNEIEKFIELAIADGQVTDKERAVILRKALELGADSDEVEMILDGKLHQQEANRPNMKSKVGNIKTCPACGDTLKPLDIDCSGCGHSLTDLTVGNSLENLSRSLLSAGDEFEKQELIRRLTPNKDKESIIDTLHYLLGQVVLSSPNEEELKTNDVLKQKSQEILSLSMIYHTNDENFMRTINDFQESLEKKFNTSTHLNIIGKKKRTRAYVANALFFIVFFGVSLLLKKLNPEENIRPTENSFKYQEYWIVSSVILFVCAIYFQYDNKQFYNRLPYLKNRN